MLSITKYLLGCRDIETIETREDSKILYVRLENDKSDPELYILENLESNLISKSFLIIEDNNSFDLNLDDLHFIGEYEFRNGVHKFFLFELRDFDSANITSFSYFTTQTMNLERLNSYNEEIYDVNRKFARLPKPDFKRVYTKEELENMHPKKQLRFLLLNKYNVPRNLINKISTNNQIEYILKEQNGFTSNPEDFIDIERKAYTRKVPKQSRKIFTNVQPLFSFDGSTTISNINYNSTTNKTLNKPQQINHKPLFSF